MPTAYWGVAEAVSVVFPDKWQGWLLLLSYLLLFFALLFHDRANLQAFTWRKWVGWLGLGLAALVTSLSLPVFFNPAAIPLIPNSADPITVSLLAAIPSLLAGVILGPAPALLVGMSSGIGRALGQSHQLYDLFHYAFAACLAAYLMRNKYRGRVYGALRMPAISGALSFGAIALMSGFVLFVTSTSATLLGRLDIALAAVQAQILPLMLEGFLGGLAVALFVLVKPTWRTNRNLVASPTQRSVRSYLLTNLFLFGVSVLVVVSAVTFALATHITTRQIVAEMAAGSIATSARFTDFHSQMEKTLIADSGSDLMEGNKVSDRALGRIYSKAQHYDEVLFIDSEQNVAGAHPNRATGVILSEKERNAVGKALRDNTRSLVLSSGEDDLSQISLVVPVVGALESSPAALIGRIKASSVTGILAGLTEVNEGSSGVIVNTDGESVAQVGAGDNLWYEAKSSEARPLSASVDFGGTALLSENDAGARELIYMTPWDAANLRVVVSVPYENVLSAAFGLAAPLVLAVLVIAGVFYSRLANYSQNLSGSILDLTQSSRFVSGGKNPNSPPAINRQDELGDLGRAFFDMQRDFRQRLDEQSLLLSVSREASTSIDLADSMPIVMQGMLRGTGASGARALVLSPTRGRPYTFSEGPSGESMKPLDRPLLAALRASDSLEMNNPTAIFERLEIDENPDLSIKALYAIKLQTKGKFLGFLTVGFRQPGRLSENDLILMQAFAEQAATLIEKSYLFANAEGGRRRLVAILKSTSEAVIVTDQTNRILIINQAMEQAFNLDAQQVVGRAVSDIIQSPILVQALSGQETSKRELEITADNGRTYFASTSTIINREGHALGRVAVLHDVTDFKVIDRLKSEFVDNVSHDLRTPLTILSGYASAMSLLDDLTPEQREYTDNILRSVEQMIGLVENLLDLGRIEAGVEISFVETDLGLLLKDLADEHWLFAHESGIRLHVRAEDALPMVRCDPGLIRQAVSNLLTNGFKYAPDSGDMTIATELSGSEVVISVRDRGPGIDQKDQLRLFEKFYRVKRHGSGKAKGSGLGLAMVKSIAERHGGDTWCQSEVGKGSTFYISLPTESA